MGTTGIDFYIGNDLFLLSQFRVLLYSNKRRVFKTPCPFLQAYAHIIVPSGVIVVVFSCFVSMLFDGLPRHLVTTNDFLRFKKTKRHHVIKKSPSSILKNHAKINNISKF